MRRVVLLAVVALVACQGGATSLKAPSPSPTLSTQPSAAPSADASSARIATPTPIPIPGVTVTSAGKTLACRLPVIWDVQVDAYTSYHMTGFLTFPTGTLTEYSSAIYAPPKVSLFYDRAYSKWLPVPRDYVSPDGRRYVYAEGDALTGETQGKVHLVDLASGVDRVLYSGAPIYRVVDFAAEGIYLTAEPGEGYGAGLWLENPAGGLPRVISRSIHGPVIAGAAAWGLAFNSADPHPVPGGLEGPYNQIARLDLVTGASTSLFYRPGANLVLLGADLSGNLVVGVLTAAGPEEVWLVTSATTMRKLATLTSPYFPSYSSLGAVDRHGIWFTGGQPGRIVWLYAGGAFAVVASANSDSFTVAGGCIP